MKYKKIYGAYGHLYGSNLALMTQFPHDLGKFFFLEFGPNDSGIYPVWNGNLYSSWGPYFYSKKDRKEWYKKVKRTMNNNPDYKDVKDMFYYLGHCTLKPFWIPVEG